MSASTELQAIESTITELIREKKPYVEKAFKALIREWLDANPLVLSVALTTASEYDDGNGYDPVIQIEDISFLLDGQPNDDDYCNIQFDLSNTVYSWAHLLHTVGIEFYGDTFTR